MNKKIWVIAVCVALGILSGCSSGVREESMSATESMPTPAPMAAPAAAAPEAAAGFAAENDEVQLQLEDASFDFGTDTVAGAAVPEQQPDKIIVSGSVNMEATQAEFDAAMNNLKAEAAAVGGYIESSGLYQNGMMEDGTILRSFNITLRVPSENYTRAWADVQSFGTVQSANENQQNVTQQYYDMQSRLDTKKVEEQRVLDLIGQTTDVQDLLDLEQMLGQIRLEIETYESKLTNIDRLASFSTITANLNEVQKITEVRIQANLGDKMKDGFIQSANATLTFLQNLALGIAYISVPLVIVIVLLAFGFGIFKLTNRKR